MKKILNIFFVTLGVIFFIIILIAIYFFVADSYNIQPLFFGVEATSSTNQRESPAATVDTTSDTALTDQQHTDKNPALNQNQEAALEAVGIDPTAVPSTISPEQESCFENAIGTARVEAIKAGDTPTAIEIFAGRNCL
jgi:hypothetical protein